MPLAASSARRARGGGAFFDVGANGGFFSLLAAKLVGPKGRVVAFEPHPETARQARAQLSLNGFTNAEVVEAAVSSSAGEAEFTDGETSVMQHLRRVSSVHVATEHLLRVRTTTLDDEAEQRVIPTVVKIDVEGAELLVLEGAKHLLSEFKPVLLIEIHTRELFHQIVPLLRGYGYTVARVSGAPVKDDEYARFVVCRAQGSTERMGPIGSKKGNGVSGRNVEI